MSPPPGPADLVRGPGSVGATAGARIGVLGAAHRALVTPWGAVVPDDGTPALEWWVAAEDRWHRPAVEPSLRQRLLDGAPVVETALAVPGGDALHRSYAVAEGGGLTVIEVENRSPSAFAVAFSRRDLLTSRPPADVPVAGMDAPAAALVVPVGHRATVRVALAHAHASGGPVAGALPATVASAAEVARGWVVHTDRHGRIELPSAGSTEMLRAERARLLLEGPGRPDDGEEFVVSVAELGRLGEDVEPYLADIAEAAGAIARRHRKAIAVPWAADAALAAAQDVLARSCDRRGALDAARARRRLLPPEATPLDPPAGPLRLAWAQRRIAVARAADGVLDLLPAPYPSAWLGRSVDADGMGVAGWTVGLALRWHGARPALLWEVSAPTQAPPRLTCSGLDSGWSAAGSSGEALLGPPEA